MIGQIMDKDMAAPDSLLRASRGAVVDKRQIPLPSGAY